MAVFPPELVGAVCILFIATRLLAIYSISHTFVGCLRFWNPPPEDELQRLDHPPEKLKRAKKVQSKDKVELTLRSAEVGTPHTRLVDHPFYEEIDTLLFLTVVMVATFIWIETYACIRASAPYDISFWCALMGLLWSVFYMLKLMYFQGWQNAEVQVSVVLGIISFLIALGVVCSPAQNILDMDLQTGFDDASNRTAALLDALDIEPPFMFSANVSRVVLALLAAAVVTIFILPTLRWARCYNDICTIHTQEMKITMLDKVLVHANFFLPFFVSMAYVRPMTMDLLLPALVECEEGAVNRDCLNVTAAAEGGAFSSVAPSFFLTESMWRRGRFCLLLLLVAVRFKLARMHFQSFLHSVKSVILSTYRRTGSVKGEDIKNRLVSQYSYLCVAVLQYLSPLLCFAYLALLIIRQGQLNLGFCSALNNTLTAAGLPESMRSRTGNPFPINVTELVPEHYRGLYANVSSTVSVYSGHKVLTPAFYGPVLDFLAWWTCTTWFLFSVIGVFYWRTLPGAYSMAGTGRIKKDMTTKPKKKEGKKKRK